MNPTLVIDIGNTSTTAALADDAGIRRALRLPTADTTPAAVAAILHRLTGRTAPRRAAICSVAPAATGAWRDAGRRISGTAPLLVGHKLRLGIKINYPRPATIGADRLANACAACHLYGAPVIAADFGTALTLDVVDARGCFIGGLILPGPGLFLDYLADRTALLPRVKLPRRLNARGAVGRNTRAAMGNGALLGCRGMFREALTALREQVPGAAVCATGGYAARVLADAGFDVTLDPDLTLRGLHRILTLNEK